MENRLAAIASGRVGEAQERVPMKQMRDYISTHFGEPLTLDILAQAAGLSTKYFSEAFKKTFGQSVTDYLTSLRIGHAKQLLRDTEWGLRDIARACGYSDEFYFSRKFKKEVGIAPSVYSEKFFNRISTTCTELTGNLLALGIIPIAAPMDPKWTPYYHYYYQSAIQVHLHYQNSGKDEENMKMLLAAKPDIVFIRKPFDENADRSVEMAGIRTVNVKSEDWKLQLREMADVLNKQEVGQAWIDTYEARLTEIRPEILQAAGQDQFAVLRLSDENLFLYTNRGIRDVLFQDLGLSTAFQQQEVCNKPITLEEVLAIKPDRLLLMVCLNARTRHHWLALQHNPQWQKLRAVQLGQLYLLPSNPWLEYSAVAVYRILEETFMLLTGKNPNPDPASVHGLWAKVGV
ncbi:helix-turn-helix domain-containing protein [Paenibacillus sp. NPDC056722]|uniref:helix-turn-helix domain-containing protein n=1 Tax=Paenibacillus sp. NPDC056722 TaxID=3345924 RepID=UPI003693D70F